jgi:Protein of unknown function (DUF3343)
MLLLATYASSHEALQAERRLKAAGLQVELIPAPRQIRSSCGFCLLAEVQDNGHLLLESGAAGLWMVQEPGPGQYRRNYEPYP